MGNHAKPSLMNTSLAGMLVSQMLASRVVEAFEELRGVELESSQLDLWIISCRGATLLRSLYDAGLARIQYSQEEKETIGNMMPSALYAIGNWIRMTCNKFPPHNNLADSRRERLGLQFLLEDYGSFVKLPELESFNEKRKKSIEQWDGLLKDWASRARDGVVDFYVPEEEDKLIVPNQKGFFNDRNNGRRREIENSLPDQVRILKFCISFPVFTAESRMNVVQHTLFELRGFPTQSKFLPASPTSAIIERVIVFLNCD